MIYFDNSASSFYKPPEVINAMANTMRFLPVNSGRGSHTLARRAGMLVYNTRRKAAALLKTDDERIVFTAGCTEALNLAIFGSPVKGGNIVTTVMEHNSVLRPVSELKRLGRVSVTFTLPQADAVIKAISPATYMVVVNHVSNVTGEKIDVAKIGDFCRRKGIVFVVDGAQSVGYHPIDMQEAKIDLLAVAPHKGLHAAQGIGILAVGENVKLKPIKHGGTGTQSLSLNQPDDLPEGFEAGTLNLPGIAALNAALSYTAKHFEANVERLKSLSAHLFEGLSKMRNVKIYSSAASLGIISFNLKNMTSMEAGDILSDQYDIAVRCGLHCAPLCHRYYGTENTGMIRASLGVDNTFGEINVFLDALREMTA